ncbi:MAG: acyl-CoA dehydrogenase family protein [Actinomycetota bacterium]|nr:acyl-CoA dehydrogenase family protein [Actinomycetota bacterium]
MSTLDANELELIRTSVRHLLEGGPNGFSVGLAELGWADLYAADPSAAVGVLAEEVGRAAAAVPLLSTVLAQALGHPGAAIVLPPLARGDGSGVPGVRAGDDVAISGLVELGLGQPATYLVATDGGVVAVDAAGLLTHPSASGDPTLGLTAVSGLLPHGPVVADATQWATAVTVGRRALAAALTGLAERMLHDATEYVLVRQQFGRPIGSFQTVKHRLADVHVAITAARAGTTTAWADGTELSAMAALCLAAKALRVASTHCHQVHGGIAFTTEHGFHTLIRRGQSWLGLLGHPDDLTRVIGERLVASRWVPRTPQLTRGAHHG